MFFSSGTVAWMTSARFCRARSLLIRQHTERGPRERPFALPVRNARTAGMEVLNMSDVSAVCPQCPPMSRYVSGGGADTLGYKLAATYGPRNGFSRPDRLTTSLPRPHRR
ncbi:hypothetical protein PCAR4_540051 [Paraburkholderia caribensis]|nr:hypothetical protein PCAR4_540051 [Paraburkholderia caribensis]